MPRCFPFIFLPRLKWKIEWVVKENHLFKSHLFAFIREMMTLMMLHMFLCRVRNILTNLFIISGFMLNFNVIATSEGNKNMFSIKWRLCHFPHMSSNVFGQLYLHQNAMRFPPPICVELKWILKNHRGQKEKKTHRYVDGKSFISLHFTRPSQAKWPKKQTGESDKNLWRVWRW